MNLIVIGFQWLGMYRRNPISPVRLIKYLIVIFIGCVIVTIPEIILDSFIDNSAIQWIVNLVVFYLYTFIFSCVAIADQEKYYKEQDQ